MVDVQSDKRVTGEPLPVRTQVTRLVDDFRTMAEAEIGYYRSRLSYSAGVAKSISIFVGLALFCVLGAFSALVLGILLALAEVIGFVAATACVSLGFVALAAICAMLARNNARKLSFPEIEGGGEK